MILIDFPGGAHGNYVEYICNRFLAGVKTNPSPFKSSGVSHAKEYYSPIKFEAKHYFQFEPKSVLGSTLISIQVKQQHLIQLIAINFLRAGEGNIDVRKLEDTLYDRLKVTNTGMIDSIRKNYINQSILGYKDIKDPKWPNCDSIEEYHQLPQYIKKELTELHNFEFWEFDENNPYCPRWIMRDYFYQGFMAEENSGFWQFCLTQERVRQTAQQSLSIDFMDLYNIDSFTNIVQQIANFTGYTFEETQEFRNIHQTFLNNQPFKNSYNFCSMLITDIINNQIDKLPELDVLQEGYICAKLCKHYDTTVDLSDARDWFKTSILLKGFVND